ncbi:diacylglycerol O-acyltransferase 1 [Pichia californica]|uniref:Diacylglycerol O-acyltransferase n=1 Tax=Pichia californica TaxID=460514 RepID=A0A9P6WHQ9_9ASCO|nr:diacylglycerol O-acyltransferase 1 [[Candida] californica]KAG0687414.1 diacylglycerol O-acyltransferase 1 [[Candida] californica]
MNYITGEFLSYPEWSFYLPSNIFFFLKSINFTTEKKRIITKEEKIGPKYLFACHPHGVISFGITASLCWGGEDNVWDTKVSDCSISEPFNDVNENDIKSSHKLKSSKSFRSLFPGISNHLLTIPTQFSLPFYRDYIMALGVGLVTKSGISSILRKNHSVTIVVGGAHESLYAKPGANKIVLNRRKGFIRIALELCTKTEEDIIHLTDEEISDNIYNGRWNNSMSDIAIVPVYVFGENNVHNVFNTTEEISENSEIMKTLLKLQLLMKKYTGFTLPLVNSRGVFNYDFGLLPYKRRMDVVTGEPIYIYRKFSKSIKDKVTDEEIDYYHEIYRNKLVELWEKHKGFATEWDENLEIVE